MRHILLAATALAMLGGAAAAQNSQSGSDSNVNVNTTSGSQSQSISNPRVNVIGNPIGNGASSSNSGAKATASTRSASKAAAVGNSTIVNVNGGSTTGRSTGTTAAGSGDPATGTASSSGDPATGTAIGSNDPTVSYSGSYTVRNTPEVIAPNVLGGNACAVGASGGIALPGFGLAMGATWADRACERRQQAALLFNMGEQKVALELLCQDDNVRSAMKTGGKACAADIAVAQVPAPVVALPDPAAPVVLMAAQMPALPKPEWCARAAPSTEASKAYVAQLCGR
jgi:hypothetical protein